MGFDVIYLPPIHPIGEVNRKGSNNTLTPTPDDVGSPWAIGSKDGGHDAVHPDLGTLEDFDAFVAEADAGRASRWRSTSRSRQPRTTRGPPSTPSGSPPAPTAPSRTRRTRRRSTRTSTRSTSTTTPRGSTPSASGCVRHWMSHGVRIFRVDNPHTKPVEFWEWLLGRIRETDPDVIFLSEAFTKPPMMQALGDGRLPPELHLLHLAQRPAPSWRPTSHEVSHETSPRAAAELLRATRPTSCTRSCSTAVRRRSRSAPSLAATGSPSWGVYAGYELCEHIGREAGQRGVPRLREVPDQDPRLGRGRPQRPDARAVPHPAQRDPPRAPRPPAAAQRHRPLQRRRRGAGVQQAATGRTTP